MPITKSAKKALRSSKRKASQNLKRKKLLKKLLKKANEKNLSTVFSKIDKAAKRNAISQNKAARIKASLSKKFGVPKGKKTIEKAPVAKTTKSPKKLSKKGSKK